MIGTRGRRTIECRMVPPTPHCPWLPLRPASAASAWTVAEANEPARPGDERVVQDHEPAKKGQAASPAERADRDPAVPWARRSNRQGAAGRPASALRPRIRTPSMSGLAAVVIACHGGSLAEWIGARPIHGALDPALAPQQPFERPAVRPPFSSNLPVAGSKSSAISVSPPRSGRGRPAQGGGVIHRAARSIGPAAEELAALWVIPGPASFRHEERRPAAVAGPELEPAGSPTRAKPVPLPAGPAELWLVRLHGAR